MRILVKVDGRWSESQAPTSPKELLKWLWEHDGKDAAVVDDESGVYYCGNEKLQDFYRTKDRTAEMFITLGRSLKV